MAASATAQSSVSAGSHQELFRLGLAHLKRRAHKEAAACFQQAIDLERDSPGKPARMKYLSFLGLALSMIDGRSEEALKLCRQAVHKEFYNADLLCNMGIVYLRNRQRGPAFDAFDRGLKLKPDHPRILAVLDRHDKRGQPLFGFLPREHPVNRLGGRLRTSLLAILPRSSDDDY
jgi:tetratricopeptide (TPR) repeat protein